NVHEFIVTRKMNMRDCLRCMRFSLAMMITRTGFYGTFVVCNFLLRQLVPFENYVLFISWFDALYIIQWYGCALALLFRYWKVFCVGASRILQKAEEGSIHFTELKKIWA
ncbi:hypothetical protein AAVH_33571, partial [Aphelenchoides avenae]